VRLMGYRRADGRIGFRNHVLIVPTCACSSETCRKVAELVPACVSIVNQNGCGEVEQNTAITREVTAGLIINPNVFGAVVIGLGCEQNEIDVLLEVVRAKTGKTVGRFVIQEEGGTAETIRKAALFAEELVRQASLCIREEVDFSGLILGTECGGSDTTSGLAANPVLGRVCDRLIDLGGTAILSETTEFIGAEHLLAARGRTKEVREDILRIVQDYEKHLLITGNSLRNGQPGPGNKKGGITTLEEKSLGCIHKGGTRPIEEVVEYGREIRKKGLIIMDTPGYDIASVTGMVAGGCQLVVFTTGRGTPTGNAIAPVIKMTANYETYQKMGENTDLDVSGVVSNKETLEEAADRVLQEVIRVANGALSKAEILGFSDICMKRLCNYI